MSSLELAEATVDKFLQIPVLNVSESHTKTAILAKLKNVSCSYIENWQRHKPFPEIFAKFV